MVMVRNERIDKVKEIVDQQGFITIKDLAEAVGISEATIRRDICNLDENGIVKKVAGGVVSLSRTVAIEPTLLAKSATNVEEKERIARAALKYISNNEHIILDSGTTLLALARLLNTDDKRITAITYDLQIISELSRFQNVESIMAGGVLRRNYGSFYGYYTENFFKEIHVEKTFLGCDAVSVNCGITSYTVDDVSVKRQIIASADEVILLCDHSKINIDTFMRVAPITSVSRIITGHEVSDKDVADIESCGINVEIV